MTAPTQGQFEFLQSIDTPTVCNLVEIVVPERRGSGYTVRHLHCPFPELPPMVGFAKTVTFKAKDAVPLGQGGYMQKRLDYLDYVAGAPRPSIMKCRLCYHPLSSPWPRPHARDSNEAIAPQSRALVKCRIQPGSWPSPMLRGKCGRLMENATQSGATRLGARKFPLSRMPP